MTNVVGLIPNNLCPNGQDVANWKHWSIPSDWAWPNVANEVPLAGANVIIPPGCVYVYDI